MWYLVLVSHPRHETSCCTVETRLTHFKSLTFWMGWVTGSIVRPFLPALSYLQDCIFETVFFTPPQQSTDPNVCTFPYYSKYCIIHRGAQTGHSEHRNMRRTAESIYLLSGWNYESNTLVVNGELTILLFCEIWWGNGEGCNEHKWVWKTNSIDPSRTKSNLMLSPFYCAVLSFLM